MNVKALSMTWKYKLYFKERRNPIYRCINFVFNNSRTGLQSKYNGKNIHTNLSNKIYVPEISFDVLKVIKFLIIHFYIQINIMDRNFNLNASELLRGQTSF